MGVLGASRVFLHFSTWYKIDPGCLLTLNSSLMQNLPTTNCKLHIKINMSYLWVWIWSGGSSWGGNFINALVTWAFRFIQTFIIQSRLIQKTLTFIQTIVFTFNITVWITLCKSCPFLFGFFDTLRARLTESMDFIRSCFFKNEPLISCPFPSSNLNPN